MASQPLDKLPPNIEALWESISIDGQPLLELLQKGKPRQPQTIAHIGHEIVQALVQAEEQSATHGANELDSHLYLLGVVLYKFCINYPVPKTDGVVESLRQVAGQPFQPIEQCNADIPLALIGLVERLLGRSNHPALSSLSDVARRLKQLANAPKLTVLRDLKLESTQASDPWQERWQQLLIGTLALLAILAIPIAWYKLSPPKKKARPAVIDVPAEPAVPLPPAVPPPPAIPSQPTP